MRRIITGCLIICVLGLGGLNAYADGASQVRIQYEEYEARFAAIEQYEDVEKNGFTVIEDQMFQEVFESFGEGTLTFFAAMDEKYSRMALFLMDEEGKIRYKTNQLETNNRIKGQMKQPTKEIAAVSFVDLDFDDRKEILIITRCVNDRGEYAGKPYKVGDVLFQGEQDFYRDYRISDKINRFGMNKNAKCIISFVRDGQSTEFLYTATTQEQLLDNGFEVIKEQCYWREFEKLGRLRVVPGYYNLGDYDVFMIYLINDRGDIVWSFQPMRDYDNLYSLRGVTGKDVDGDGMKDLVVLARYSYETPTGELLVESACSIYYQRTGGFDIDREFTENFQCTEKHTMEEVVTAIRAYWGWQTETKEAAKLQRRTND